MKPVFSSLTVAVCVAAGLLSYQNLGKFRDQRQKKEHASMAARLITQQADGIDAELTREKDTLASSRTEEASLQASVGKLEVTEKQLRAEIAKVDGTLEEQNAQIAKFEELLNHMGIGPASGTDFSTAIAELAAAADQLAQDLNTRRAELADLETSIANTRSNLQTNREEMAYLARAEEARNARFRDNAAEGVILSANQDWGFAELQDGGGFDPAARLLVSRGGRLVGELRTAAAGPAQVNQRSLTTGARIQPGDQVILADAHTH